MDVCADSPAMRVKIERASCLGLGRTARDNTNEIALVVKHRRTLTTVHEIIVGGQNWGSGSSREHAAWAIAGYGVRVVISSSFADIHRNNLLNCFVLPVIVSKAFQQELFASIAADPKTEVKVDVPAQTVTNMATGNSEHFDINAYKKYCLMNAYDDIDFLLSNKDKIEQFEQRQ